MVLNNMAANGLGLAEVVEIRERQPNPCIKDKLKTILEPLFFSPYNAKPLLADGLLRFKFYCFVNVVNQWFCRLKIVHNSFYCAFACQHFVANYFLGAKTFHFK